MLNAGFGHSAGMVIITAEIIGNFNINNNLNLFYIKGSSGVLDTICKLRGYVSPSGIPTANRAMNYAM